MQFSVNSNALVGLSDLMDRRWEDFESARGYLRANTRFSFFDTGVLNAIWGEHQGIVDEIDGFLAAAAGVAGQIATGVTEANVTYRRSDRAAVVPNDVLLAGAPAREGPAPSATPPATSSAAALADVSLDRSAFGDPHTPTTRIMPPPDHRAEYPYQLSYFDVLSPTTMLRDGIWEATSVLTTFGLLDPLRHP